MMTHKEMTAHVRGRLRHEQIEARCSMVTITGMPAVSIAPTTADARFTVEEQRTIRQILAANRLTTVEGSIIEVTDLDVNGHGWWAFLPIEEHTS